MKNFQILFILTTNVLLVLFEIFSNTDGPIPNSSVTSTALFWMSKYKFQLVFLTIQLVLYLGSQRWVSFVLPLCMLILCDRRNYYVVGFILVLPLLSYGISKFHLFPDMKVSGYIINQNQHDLIAKKIKFVLNKILDQHNHDVQVARILRTCLLQNERMSEQQKLNGLIKILIRNTVVQSFEERIHN